MGLFGIEAPENPDPGGYAAPITPGYGGGLFEMNTELGGGWSGNACNYQLDQ